jgi:hypothetical protein
LLAFTLKLLRLVPLNLCCSKPIPVAWEYPGNAGVMVSRKSLSYFETMRCLAKKRILPPGKKNLLVFVLLIIQMTKTGGKRKLYIL